MRYYSLRKLRSHHPHIIHSSFQLKLTVLFVSFLGFLMNSCIGGGGGGGSAGGTSTGGSTFSSVAQGIRISGNGLDGPISYGYVDFYSSDGSLCASTATDENSFYEVVIPPSCTFPLRVELSGGDDLSSQMANPTTLYSLVPDTNVTTLNINSYTTLIYYAALAKTSNFSMPAIVSEGVDVNAVTQQIIRKFNFGIDADDPNFEPLSSRINLNNIASFIKANEGLMECVRRTAQDASADANLDAFGINEIMRALGSDISDGTLDGLNRNFGQQTITALDQGGSKLVGLWENNALFVGLELMTNRLSLSLTDEQLALKAESLGLPVGALVTYINANQVMTNLARAIENIASDMGGFITEAEAQAKLEQLGVTAKFLNQTQAALSFQLSIAVSEGLSADYIAYLERLQENLQNIARSTNLNETLQASYNDISIFLEWTYTNIVSGSNDVPTIINDPETPEEPINNGINQAQLQINTSVPLPLNTRKILASWSYGTPNPQSFRLYKTSQAGTQLVCVIPGQYRTTDYSDCLINLQEIPVSFALTAYSSGVESLPSASITYNNTPPAAQFQASFITGSVPLSVEFDPTLSSDTDGRITKYSWDFGDGSAPYESSSPETVPHTYDYTGSYDIMLSVWDDDQLKAQATLRIDVGDAPTLTPDAQAAFVGSMVVLLDDSSPEQNKKTTILSSEAPGEASSSFMQDDTIALNFSHDTVSYPPEKALPLAKEQSTAPNKKETPQESSSLDSQVHKFLNDWIMAWEQSSGTTGKISDYLSLYSDKFVSESSSKTAWGMNKERINKSKSFIKVQLTDIDVKETPSGNIKVTFQQKYNSSNYSDTSKKVLLLTKENNSWKILTEMAL